MNTFRTLLSLCILILAALTSPNYANAETLLGSFQVTKSGGTPNISGWACSVGSPNSVWVQAFYDGAYPIGQLSATVTANQPSSPQVNSICANGGSDHNFTISVTPEELLKQGGHPAFLYAISSAGNVLLLNGSGSSKLPVYDPMPADPRVCSLAQGDPNGCLQNIASYDKISLASNIECANVGTCCPGGQALFNISGNKSHFEIEGNGFLLTRGSNQNSQAGQKQCPAIQISQASDILIDDLRLDDESLSNPCAYEELSLGDCKKTHGATILVVNSRNVKIHNVSVNNGPGYVISANNVNGFIVDDSAIADAGVIGVYVGKINPPSEQSQNVVISDSVIEGARANGIAIRGAVADAADPVLVSNNILNRNQWVGVWPVETGDQALSPGGQLLLDDGTDLEVVNNIISDGLCSACYRTETSVGSGISAVEIGDPNAPSLGVNGLYLHDNYFYNGGDTSAVYENPGSTEAALQFKDNLTTGFGNFTNVSAQNSVLQNNYSVQAVPNLSLNGGAYYMINREATEDYDTPDPAIDTIRWASKLPGELESIVNCNPGNSCPIYEEGTFQLSSGPVVGGPPRPLFRCFAGPQVDGQYISPIAASLDDFISLDQHCDGQGLLHSIAGYSFAGPNPARNIYGVYECHTVYAGGIISHFVSWDPACEGQTLDESLGFAMAPSKSNIKMPSLARSNSEGSPAGSG